MKTHKAIGLFFLSLSVILAGCTVRTYKLTRDRIDQDLSAGNRGYIMGSAPAIEESARKTTRTTQVVEVELGSPVKLKKGAGASEGQADYEYPQGNEEVAQEGNVVEEAGTTAVSFEKYTVKKGDTLQKISKKFYGTSKKWMRIYNANKANLGGPNKIYPGQTLNIPIEPLKEPKANLK